MIINFTKFNDKFFKIVKVIKFPQNLNFKLCGCHGKESPHINTNISLAVIPNADQMYQVCWESLQTNTSFYMFLQYWHSNN